MLGTIDGETEMGRFTVCIEVDTVDGAVVLGLVDTGFADGVS